MEDVEPGGAVLRVIGLIEQRRHAEWNMPRELSGGLFARFVEFEAQMQGAWPGSEQVGGERRHGTGHDDAEGPKNHLLHAGGCGGPAPR
jgi:hypothetical protein